MELNQRPKDEVAATIPGNINQCKVKGLHDNYRTRHGVICLNHLSTMNLIRVR